MIVKTLPMAQLQLYSSRIMSLVVLSCMSHVAPVGKQSPKQREVAEPPPGAAGAGASIIS